MKHSTRSHGKQLDEKTRWKDIQKEQLDIKTRWKDIQKEQLDVKTRWEDIQKGLTIEHGIGNGTTWSIYLSITHAKRVAVVTG